MAFTKEQLRDALIQPQEGDKMAIRNTAGGAWDCAQEAKQYRNPLPHDIASDSYLGGRICGPEVCAPPATPRPAVEEGICDLGNAVEGLAKQLAELEMRLNPVMAPRVERDEKNATGGIAGSAGYVADALRAFDYKVRVMSQQIARMHDRLQV
jgi:hypothetical protein